MENGGAETAPLFLLLKLANFKYGQGVKAVLGFCLGPESAGKRIKFFPCLPK